MKLKLSVVATLSALAIISGAARAEIVAGITSIQDREILNSSAVVALQATDAAIRISGIFIDTDLADTGLGGFVVVRHDESGNSYDIPMVRRGWSEKAIHYMPVGEEVDPSLQSKFLDAGWLAIADAFTLPTGTYSVVGLRMTRRSGQPTFTALGDQTTPYAARFTVPLVRSIPGVTLTDKDGNPLTQVQYSMVEGKPGFSLSNYPALAEERYQLKVQPYNKYGKPNPTHAELLIDYARPVLRQAIRIPQVANFPGVKTLVALTNPFDGQPFSEELEAKVTYETGGNNSLLFNGQSVNPGAPLSIRIPLPDANMRSAFQVAIPDSNGVAKVWINKPDAPTIELSMVTWNPDTTINVGPEKAGYTAILDEARLSATIVPRNPDCTKVVSYALDREIPETFDSPTCAIRWVNLPAGLATEKTPTGVSTGSTLASGAFQTDGPQTAEVAKGVVWTDPVTRQSAFYPTANTTQVTVQSFTFDQDAPQMGFQAMGFYETLPLGPNGENYVYAGQKERVGRAMVKMKYRDISVRISPVDTNTGEDPVTVISNTDEAVLPVTVNVPTVFQEKEYKIEAWYNKYPSNKYSQTVKFIGIPTNPSLILDSIKTAGITTEDSIVNGTLAKWNPYRRGFEYSYATSGHWRVQLHRFLDRVNTEPIGSPVDVEEGAGRFSINLGRLPAGAYPILATAVITDEVAVNPASTSKMQFLPVANGDAIQARLISKNTDGYAPFKAGVGLIFEDMKRVRDISKIIFEMSKDAGVTWEVMPDDPKQRKTTFSKGFVLDTAQDVQIRAKIITNRSNVVFYTDPLDFSAYDLPSYAIAGPSFVMTGRPFTLSIVNKGIGSAEFSWKVEALTLNTPITGVGTSIDLTFNNPDNYKVTVVGKAVGAPDESRVVLPVIKTGWIQARPADLANPAISGPSLIETGKPHVFKAIVPKLPAGAVEKVVGQWILPNGDKIPGTGDLTFIPPHNPNGAPTSYSTISYEAWLEGIPTIRRTARWTPKTWTYSFPSNWTMMTYLKDPVAPATVTFNTEPVGTLYTNNEPLTYTWQFPPSAKVIGQKAGGAIIELAEAGSHNAVLTVNDTRGNSAVITSNTVQVTPSPPLSLAVSGGIQDRWNRAPSTAFVAAKLLTVPKADYVTGYVYKVNGVEVMRSNMAYAALPISDAGTYEIEVTANTKNGKFGSNTTSLTFVEGTPPTCSIASAGDGVTGLSLKANCVSTQGYVIGYRWLVNGEESPVKTATVGFPASWLQANGRPNVTLEATNDKGQRVTATY